MGSSSTSGSAEAIVIIKAAPQVGQQHGETVCCAGIDLQGKWLRLYPVSFQLLDDHRKFARWDRIRFNWRLPNDDQRPESKRVDQNSIEICGSIKPRERPDFLARSVVTSLRREREAGRSLALLRAEIVDFVIEPKTEAELAEELAKFEADRAQADLFTKQSIPYQPCPYRFKYRYRMEDGTWFGTCQDWETEATYFRLENELGRAAALARMSQVFGNEYPRKGMLLAMGTHSRYPDTWLINGVIRLTETNQGSLF